MPAERAPAPCVFRASNKARASGGERGPDRSGADLQRATEVVTAGHRQSLELSKVPPLTIYFGKCRSRRLAPFGTAAYCGAMPLTRGRFPGRPVPSAKIQAENPGTTGVFSTLTANNTRPRPKHACESTVCADGHIARHDDRPFSKPAAVAAACGASADVGPAPPEYLHLRRALSPVRRVHRGCHFRRSGRRPPR